MFFSKFPTINYDSENIRDVSVSIVIPERIRENKDLFFYYQIEDGDTADSVSFDFYGNSHYNFIILLMNNMVDPFWDWPMNTRELIKYCETRYGVPTIVDGKYQTDGYFAVKYWQDTSGRIYTEDPSPVSAAAVSFYEYEEQLNIKKRTIKILHKELIRDFQKEINYLINGSQ